jgi:hypothetical protein
MKLNKNIILIFVLLVAGINGLANAEELVRVLNLKGYWKFSIGDDKRWALPTYNDNDWEEIRVPSSWEDEGFHGYNGYAWYRKSFDYPSGIKSEILYLDMGRIDDVDEVYVNGNLVGYTGSFPPNYVSAYGAWRKYPVPVKFLNQNGKNVISVRVFDAELEGGMVDGNYGFYVRQYSLIPEISFEGREWKFSTGDDKSWKEPGYNDNNWDKIIVPGKWENQGYNDYDGFGWYRYTFKASAGLKDKNLVLILGKIDDIDEVYLNGQLVGSTGRMYDNPARIRHNDNNCQQFRGYFLPQGILKINQENVIAVRVYDDYLDGGIIEGPIGITTQEKYTKYWRNRKTSERKSIFDIWFNN